MNDELSSLNDLFQSHQINALRLDEQRSLLDAMTAKKPVYRDRVGNLVEYQGEVYFIEEIRKNRLLLKSEEKMCFKSVDDPGLKRLKGNQMLKQAEKLLVDAQGQLNGRHFDLYQMSFELLYMDSKKYAAIKGSKIQLLPHQIQAVYQIVNSFHQRFLIADEVGLGKTIETGLLIKEFTMRYRYERVLVITPASLQLQWQQELKEKFDEEFVVLDSRLVKKLGGMTQALKIDSRFIISLDYAKQKDILEVLSHAIWDMVIFDEAHRLRRDRNKITQAYRLAQALSARAKAFFLLSATPFSGKLEELYFFMALLNKSRLGSLQSFIEAYYNEGGAFLQGLFSDFTIRRTKKDVGGFTRRNAYTIKYALSPLEKNFYDQMSDFVKNEYRKAVENKANPRALMLTFFQKMMDSSMAAILRAIANRLMALDELIEALSQERKRIEAIDKQTLAFFEADGDFDDEDIPDRLGGEEYDLDELKKERIFLAGVEVLGKNIDKNTKAETLEKLMREIRKDNEREKVIIFTQFKSTMFHLAETFPEMNPVVFHGSMSKEEKDEAVEKFRRDCDLFIATEAGGEGRNLQFSKTLINYDLPWNPFKMEQRIGRIHRFGQKHDVQIYNFAMEESIGERILEIIGEKVKIFEDAFGETQPLIGAIEGGTRSLEKIFMSAGSTEEIAKEIDKKLSLSRNKMKQLVIASHYKNQKIDTAAIQAETERLEKKLEQFFILYVEEHPEDLQLLKTYSLAGNRFYKVKKLFPTPKNFNYAFDFQSVEKAIEENQNSSRENFEYLHIEHPLIKHMLKKAATLRLDRAVQRPEDEKTVTKIEFNFILKTEDIHREERCVRIIMPVKDSVDASYEDACDQMRHLSETEAETIIRKNRPMVEAEIKKVEESYQRQISEMDEVLDTYEHKNKQSGEDRYFLLIPKIRKQVQQLKRDREDIVKLTRARLKVQVDFYLFSIRLLA